MIFPRARTDRLVIQELPDETLVFDQLHNKAHCLNQVTALVWKHCDGRTGLSAMARQTGLAEPLVQLALEQLASRQLLEGTIERGSPAQRRSRREVLKRLAAAATLPAILTVAAPRANAAGSPPFTCSAKPDGTNCGGSGLLCCTNTCVNTNTDSNNCSRCGLICSAGSSCNNSRCCIAAGTIPHPAACSACCTGQCSTPGNNSTACT